MGINRKLDALVAVEVMGLSPEAVRCWPRTKDEAWAALQKGELHTPFEVYKDVSGISWHCNRYGCDCSIYEGHPIPICLASVPLYSANIADAWDVVEWMRQSGYIVKFWSPNGGPYKGQWEVIAWKRIVSATGEDDPEMRAVWEDTKEVGTGIDMPQPRLPHWQSV